MLNDHEYQLRSLEALQKAVTEALERKRRLGQYAVIWRNGRPQRIEPGSIDESSDDSRSDDAND